MELFVDLVPPDEPAPSYPGENHGGRPWYLRSYTRSPIKLAPPMAPVPILVVYWGRWADWTGGVGPWSKTVVSRVEGGSRLPLSFRFDRKTTRYLEYAMMPRPEDRQTIYRVAVLQGQIRLLNPPQVAAELPGPQEQRQLEGPETKEAA